MKTTIFKDCYLGKTDFKKDKSSFVLHCTVTLASLLIDSIHLFYSSTHSCIIDLGQRDHRFVWLKDRSERMLRNLSLQITIMACHFDEKVLPRDWPLKVTLWRKRKKKYADKKDEDEGNIGEWSEWPVATGTGDEHWWEHVAQRALKGCRCPFIVLLTAHCCEVRSVIGDEVVSDWLVKRIGINSTRNC